MRIQVTAMPSSKRASLEMMGPAEYVVAVREPLVQGRANEAIVGALAAHSGTSASEIMLVTEKTSRRRAFGVPLDGNRS